MDEYEALLKEGTPEAAVDEYDSLLKGDTPAGTFDEYDELLGRTPMQSPENEPSIAPTFNAIRDFVKADPTVPFEITDFNKKQVGGALWTMAGSIAEGTLGNLTKAATGKDLATTMLGAEKGAELRGNLEAAQRERWISSTAGSLIGTSIEFYGLKSTKGLLFPALNVYHEFGRQREAGEFNLGGYGKEAAKGVAEAFVFGKAGMIPGKVKAAALTSAGIGTIQVAEQMLSEENPIDPDNLMETFIPTAATFGLTLLTHGKKISDDIVAKKPVAEPKAPVMPTKPEDMPIPPKVFNRYWKRMEEPIDSLAKEPTPPQIGKDGERVSKDVVDPGFLKFKELVSKVPGLKDLPEKDFIAPGAEVGGKTGEGLQAAYGNAMITLKSANDKIAIKLQNGASLDEVNAIRKTALAEVENSLFLRANKGFFQNTPDKAAARMAKVEARKVMTADPTYKSVLLDDVDQALGKVPDVKKPLGQIVKEKWDDVKKAYIAGRSAWDVRYAQTSVAYEEAVVGAGGKNPTFFQNVAREFEAVNKAMGRATADVMPFANELRNLPDTARGAVPRMIFLKRVGARLQDDLEGKKFGNWTPEMVETAMKDLERQVGTKAFRRAEGVVTKFTEMTDKMLADAVKYSLISQADAAVMKASNDFYATFKNLKYMLDDAKPFRGKRGGVGPFSKAIVGAEEGTVVDDIIGSTVGSMLKNHIAGLRNIAFGSVAKVAELFPQGNSFRVLVNPKDVKQRMLLTAELAKLRDERAALQTAQSTAKRSWKAVASFITNLAEFKGNGRIRELNKRLSRHNKEYSRLYKEVDELIYMSNDKGVTKVTNAMIRREALINHNMKQLAEETAIIKERSFRKLPPALEDFNRLTKLMDNLDELLADKKGELGQIRSILGAIPKDLDLSRVFKDPANYTAVSYKVEGVTGKLAIRNNILNEINMNTASGSVVRSVIDGNFRATTTAFAPWYQTVNTYRDLSTYMVFNQNGLRTLFRGGNLIDNMVDLAKIPSDFYRGVKAAISLGAGLPNKDAELYLRDGAGVSSTIRGMWADDFFKSLITPFGNSPKSYMAKTMHTIKASLLNGTALLEDTTRMFDSIRGNRFLEFMEKQGKADTELRRKLYHNNTALVSFGDTANVGPGLADANKVITFMAARIKSTYAGIGLLRGKYGAREAAETWASLATVASPMLWLAMNNRTTENAADYEAVPPYEKQNNIMIPLPGYFINNKGERKRNYAKLPVDGILKLTWNGVDTAVGGAKGQLSPKHMQNLANTVGSELMVIPPNFGEPLDVKVQGAMATMLPSYRMPTEIVANKTLFSNKPILTQQEKLAPPSEQWDYTTPGWQVKAAEYARDHTGMEVSPKMMDWTLESMFSASYKSLKDRPDEQREWLRQFPGSLTQRYVGSAGVYDPDIEYADEYVKMEGTRKVKFSRAADEILRLTSEGDIDEAQVGLLRVAEQDPSFVEYFSRKLKEEVQGKSNLTSTMKTLSVGPRASMMNTILKSKSQSAGAQFMQEMISAGVMTEDVIAEMMHLNKTQNIPLLNTLGGNK